jgi:lysophospholipase L1-like esterase
LALLAMLAWSGFLQGAEPAKIRVVLIGDSTVASKSGWGDAFGKLLGDRAECFNDAKGGASTKSFRDGGYWKTAISHKPDWLLIQFGHNDQPGKGPARETDAATTFAENLARYVDEARAAGARPVLVTSLTRRTFSGGKIVSDLLVGYVAATKRVAAEKNVPLVDLNARSIEQVEKLGAAGLSEMEPEGKKPGTKDHTHLTELGGEMVAPLVVAELRKVAPELAALCAPTK